MLILTTDAVINNPNGYGFELSNVNSAAGTATLTITLPTPLPFFTINYTGINNGL